MTPTTFPASGPSGGDGAAPAADPAADSVFWTCTGLCHAPPGGGPTLFGGMDLRIGAGATLLRGGDGRGKTTLLRIIAGQELPRQGCIAAAPRDVFWLDPRGGNGDGAGENGRGAPGAAQTPAGWWAAQALRWPGWRADALAAHIEGFGLADHAGKRMEQLSTGTRRKVLLAAGFASGARWLLVDEPVAGLDRASIAYLRQCLAEAATRGDRGVVVAHYDTLDGVPWTQVVELGD